ncbi:MAG: hypothetical protein J5I92_01420 [Thiogranum sp.]|nr:hypothetical protein [Thiogranum sp.]
MNRRIALKLARVFVACVATAAIADAAPLVAELDEKSFQESYSPEVSVSGAVIVGVASSRALTGSATGSLAVFSPPDIGENKACLTMVSRDGAYYLRAVFTMKVPQAQSGEPVQLPFRSGKRDVLKDYQTGDIAMLATRGDCSSSGQSYYLVDEFDDKLKSAAPEFVRVYVNSFGATDVYYKIGDAGELVECAFIDAGQRTSFDYFCDLQWSSIAAAPPVQILRERFGRELPDVHLNLRIAPRQ